MYGATNAATNKITVNGQAASKTISPGEAVLQGELCKVVPTGNINQIYTADFSENNISVERQPKAVQVGDKYCVQVGNDSISFIQFSPSVADATSGRGYLLSAEGEDGMNPRNLMLPAFVYSQDTAVCFSYNSSGYAYVQRVTKTAENFDYDSVSLGRGDSTGSLVCQISKNKYFCGMDYSEMCICEITDSGITTGAKFSDSSHQWDSYHSLIVAASDSTGYLLQASGQMNGNSTWRLYKYKFNSDNSIQFLSSYQHNNLGGLVYDDTGNLDWIYALGENKLLLTGYVTREHYFFITIIDIDENGDFSCSATYKEQFESSEGDSDKNVFIVGNDTLVILNCQDYVTYTAYVYHISDNAITHIGTTSLGAYGIDYVSYLGVFTDNEDKTIFHYYGSNNDISYINYQLPVGNIAPYRGGVAFDIVYAAESGNAGSAINVITPENS